MKTDKTLDYVLDLIAELERNNQQVTQDKLASALNITINAAAGIVLQAGYRALRLQYAHDARFALKALRLDADDFKVLTDLPKVKAHRPTSETVSGKNNAAKLAERRNGMGAKLANLSREVEMALTLYDSWRLGNGKRLGDASRSDLLAEVVTTQAIANGALKNVAFYSKLADLVPEGQTVSQAIPLAEAHKLREACYASA